MKNIRLIMLGVLCLLFVIHVGGCKDDDGGDSAVGYNLTTQKDVNNFLESGNISYLIISGEDITDLSALKFASIGSLIIRNTNVLDLSLPNLTSVQEELRIEGNSKLIKISDLSKLKEINGELVINNNVLLTDISGLWTYRVVPVLLVLLIIKPWEKISLWWEKIILMDCSH